MIFIGNLTQVYLIGHSEQLKIGNKIIRGIEKITYNNLKTNLIRINKEYPLSSNRIKNKTISFDENIDKIIKDLK